MDSNIILAVVAAVVLVIFIFVVFIYLVSRQRVSALEAEKRKYFSLISSHELFSQEKYELAVLDAYKSLELALKKRFPDKQSDNGIGTSFDLINYAEQRGFLSGSQVSKAHFARIQRNRVAHDRASISKQTAAEVIGNVKEVLTALGTKPSLGLFQISDEELVQNIRRQR